MHVIHYCDVDDAYFSHLKIVSLFSYVLRMWDSLNIYEEKYRHKVLHDTIMTTAKVGRLSDLLWHNKKIVLEATN